MTALLLSFEALAALCILFAVVYGVARWIDNYGIVDIAWSYSFAATAIAYALLGDGAPVRRSMMAAMAVVWSLRLGTHLLIRIATKHPTEDGRYRQLRRDWGAGFDLKMAGFFQLQAASVVFLSIPFLVACTNPDPAVEWIEWAASALWIVAISGEALADAQLSLFKRKTQNTGIECDSGLWRYSRHPNYFFEWLIWVSFFLFGCASPWGYIGILSPTCILYLLLRVTGIPATEEQSLRSKGDAYRAYQRATSAFVPLPRKAVHP